MYLNGVMLVSCALDFQVLRFDHGNDLPHDPLPADVRGHRLVPQAPRRRPAEKGPAQVPRRSRGVRGRRVRARALPGRAAARRRRARRSWPSVARYTGLSADYVERTDLRIEIFRFCKELLRAEGRTVGPPGFSRYTGIDRDGAGERFEFDPAMAEIYGAYAAAMNDYVRGDAQVRGRPALRGHQVALPRLGLEGLRQPLRRRRRDAAPRDGDEPEDARAGGERLLRPRHPALRGRLLARPPGHSGRACGATSM